MNGKGDHSTLTCSKLKAQDDETRRSDNRITPYMLPFSHMVYPQESKDIKSESWDQVKLCSMIVLLKLPNPIDDLHVCSIELGGAACPHTWTST